MGVETNGKTYNSPASRKGAEAFIAQSLTTVLHNYPYLIPYMQEISGFDSQTFKHSISVAEVSTRAYANYARATNLPLEDLKNDTITLSLGGFVHDIGKAGIKRYSLEDSVQALYPEVNHTAPINLAAHNTLTQDEKNLIDTHSMIGGYIVRNLCNSLPISRAISARISDFAFSHHQKPTDLISPVHSNSRGLSLRKYSKDALLHTFLALSDIAVSMREPRSYRNFLSLPKSIIFEELNTELSHSLISSIFGNHLNESNIANIRKEMVGYIMSAIDEIDIALTQREYDIEGWRINGSDWHSTPPEKAVLIPLLVKKVWANSDHDKDF